MRPGRPGFAVFAVEDTSAQICWRSLPQGHAVVTAGDASAGFDVDSTDACGAVSIGPLLAGRAYDAVVRVDGRPVASRSFRTLTPPPGERLGSFATISDLHVGESRFGLLPSFGEPPTTPEAERYPARCARAAIAEASAWGATRLLAKGDLTWSGRRRQWEIVGHLLRDAPIPVHATLGNHDVGPKGVDGRAALAVYGIDIPAAPEVVDVPGLRIVVGHTADYGHRRGHVDATAREQLVQAVAEARGPVLVALHHYPDPLPFRSRYPRGIPKAQGEPLLRALAAANRDTFLTFGHSHRHRRHLRYGMPATEVGSTKDYPGVWAGYVVHEGGIRQVVRRVSQPDCIAWTDRTRAAVGGLWGPWAAGRRSWRCFSWEWGEAQQ